MMGIFAFYNGLIYNEWFALPMELFNSCYSKEPEVLSVAVTGGANPKFVGFQSYGYKKVSDNCVYPLGYDSRWFQADTNLSYANGLKMKLSVIFGVLQMTFGIIMKGLNAVYFKRWLEFGVEFIP